MPLATLIDVAPGQWTAFPSDVSSAFADLLRSTSYVQASVDDEPAATLLVREEEMAQAPSVLLSLTVEEIAQIVDMMLARVRDQLRAQQMQLEVTQAAKEHIIKLGYDVAYGARPLRRVIQNMIEDVLAEHLLLGKYEPGSTIVVDKDPEAGLDIRLAEPLTPVEAR